ncbi:histidine triad nucleotide-binding protein [Nostocoides sp.]|uniref:histidine triad nucleotide-binding protein n=1 Tax=Nostocoides sp. TaxID=1917966 RepID=UPI002CE43809|nr:histidine triad nucleotide-binding protein [Tetrasphaera sp.]
MSQCLFCALVARDIPADVVAESDLALAFRDIDPQAPTHVLVIPKRHVANAAELAAHPQDLAAVFALAGQVADEQGLEAGYRLVTNTGAEAGQSVFHAHVHLLGGRGLTWPPG